MVAIVLQESELAAAAQQLLAHHAGARVFAVSAPMGAGKTTLIKALCLQLGTVDSLSSPTYSIVNQYQDPVGDPIYHMDIYRLESVEEALEIGIEEYLYSGHYVFIEWPQLIADLLPKGTVQVTIEVTGPTSRQLTSQ